MAALRSTDRSDVRDARERPRVAHVTEALGGGVHTAVQQYILNSPHAEHVVIARNRNASKVVDDSASISRIVTLPDSRGFTKFARHAMAAINQVDATHVHLHSSYAGQLRHILHHRDYKVIYSPHCFAFERRDKNPGQRIAYKLLERAAASRFPHVIAGVSKYESRTAESLAKNVQAIELPNTYGDSGTISSELLRSRMTEPIPSIVTVGRVDKQKAPDFCAQVAQKVTNAGVKWTWVGDGNRLEVQGLQRAGVEVTGWLPRSEALDILAKSGLYVHTASWEGLPMAALEARSMGLPVLMRKTRTTAGLSFQQFADTADCVSKIASFFEDAEFRNSMLDRELEYHRLQCEDATKQAEVLLRLYAV